MGDDAFITMRTIDNFVHGHGLRWNIAERVQAYTHPLWLMVLTLPYYITGEVFVTVIIISILISGSAVALCVKRLAPSVPAGCLALLALAMSRSVVDYSTSGLENPLSHLLIVCFFLVYIRPTWTSKTYLALIFVASLVGLNRMDLFVLVAPVCIYAFFQQPFKKGIKYGFLGMLPFFLWEFFSLIYYGSLVPNTALAKLSHGIPARELWGQGRVYLFTQLRFDPLGLLILVAGILVPWLLPRAKRWPWVCAGLGVLCYVLYTISVGGDFMAGRFFSTPIVASTCIILGVMKTAYDTRAAEISPSTYQVVGLLIFGLGYCAEFPTLKPVWSAPEQPWHSGIVDERLFWGDKNALVYSRRTSKPPYRGPIHRDDDEEKVVIQQAVGMSGFSAGPNVHIIDPLALGDPLLARLPLRPRKGWRIGHYRHQIPAGYLESVVAKESVFLDPNIGNYWDHIRRATRGDLFSTQRWKSIWLLNRYSVEEFIDVSFYHKPRYDEVPSWVLERAKPNEHKADGEGTFQIPETGLMVHFDHVIRCGSLSVSIDDNDVYGFEFLLEDQEDKMVTIEPKKNRKGGLKTRTVKVPSQSKKRGFDRVRVSCVKTSRRCFVGHLFPMLKDGE